MSRRAHVCANWPDLALRLVTSVQIASIENLSYIFVMLQSPPDAARPAEPTIDAGMVLISEQLRARLLTLMEESGFAASGLPPGPGDPGIRHAVVLFELGSRAGHDLSDLAAFRAHAGGDVLVLALGHGGRRAHLRALDAGADDYLSLPLDAQLLSARLRAFARLANSIVRGQLRLGNLVLDRLTRSLIVGARRTHLTPREYGMLEFLLLQPGRVCARSDLLQEVLHVRHDPGTNVLEVNIARVRARLTRAGANLRIRAERESGYVIETRLQAL